MEVNAGEVILNDFTKLGELAPVIKMKRITISIATPAGNAAQQAAHGLNTSKIVGYTCIMTKANGSVITPESTAEAESLFTANLTTTVCRVAYDGANNIGIHNSTVTFLITYTS